MQAMGRQCWWLSVSQYVHRPGPKRRLSNFSPHRLSPAVSAPDKRQSFSLRSNSVQAAPNDAITTAAAAPATTAMEELPRQPVAASKKTEKTARSQNRTNRGWYDAYAWRRQHADYGRGRAYGHERPSSSW